MNMFDRFLCQRVWDGFDSSYMHREGVVLALQGIGN